MNMVMALNLIVPLMTYHTNDTGFNNRNHGLGLELEHGDFAYSIVTVADNSNGDTSIYASVLYNKTVTTNTSMLLGLSAASGYEDAAVFPVLSVQFYNMRMSTTFPASKMLCEENDIGERYTDNRCKFGENCGLKKCHDIFNIQYIMGF